MAAEGFIGRWSRLKRNPAPAGPTAHDGSQPGAADPEAIGPGLEPAPPATLNADGRDLPQAALPRQRVDRAPLPSIDSLGKDCDISMFMQPDVDPGLRLSALKKLFTDPHFNQMDGLDTYIDDYSKPDPMPLAFLRRLDQSRLLGLAGDDPPVPQGPSEAPADGQGAVARTDPEAGAIGDGTGAAPADETGAIAAHDAGAITANAVAYAPAGSPGEQTS